MNYYVKLAMALLSGDGDQARLLRESEKAKSALKAQISIREGERFQLEDAVTSAEEDLKTTEVTFTNASNYIQSLITGQNNVTKAKKALADFDKVTEYLKTTLEKISKEEKK